MFPPSSLRQRRSVAGSNPSRWRVSQTNTPRGYLRRARGAALMFASRNALTKAMSADLNASPVVVDRSSRDRRKTMSTTMMLCFASHLLHGPLRPLLRRTGRERDGVLNHSAHRYVPRPRGSQGSLVRTSRAREVPGRTQRPLVSSSLVLVAGSESATFAESCGAGSSVRCASSWAATAAP